MRSLYSNLLKGNTTYVVPDGTRIIDTNDLIAKKLEDIHNNPQKSSKGGFRIGLKADEIAVKEGENILSDGSDFTEIGQPVEYDGPSPEELIEEARLKIAKMEEEASAHLEMERNRVIGEAKESGYREGFERGKLDGLNQVDELKEGLEEERRKIYQEYQQLVEELEPQFIDHLTGIYEHLFQVEIGVYRDVLVHLITRAMSRIEGAKDYLVHVSKEDFPYITMQKKQIQAESMMGNSTMEIIEDLSLKKNECLIETEGGIFDCGLGTQLSELTRKLKLLSYEKREQ